MSSRRGQSRPQRFRKTFRVWRRLESLVEKWRAFNWATLEINGHNVRQILEALDTAGEIHHRPTAIIAHTTKGKGVSFMENDATWHGISPDEAQYARALAELEGEG